MLFDELIHAAGVRIHHLAGFGIEKRGFALCSSCEAIRSKALINLERPRTKYFRKLPARGASQQIHLPKPVLRHDVPLRLRKVFHRRSANVRHAPAIALHRNFLTETRQRNASIDLWQRPVNKPPCHRGASNHENGENPVEHPKNGSQVHSNRDYAKIQCRGGASCAQPSRRQL